MLFYVMLCTPTHEHQLDLDIEGGEGANVLMCYNICDRDCSFNVELDLILAKVFY